MVPVTELWLPIIVATAVVFVASFITHMVLPLHRNDLKKLPAEDDVMNAIRPFNISPGDYMMPCAGKPSDMNTPAFKEKMNRGPVALMTVRPTGPPTMGPSLAKWAIYCLVVSIFSAYIAGAALPPGTDYLAVFRFAGTMAFAAYSLALWQTAIWYGRSAVTTIKDTVDGLLYALLTAGVMGWLWPR